MTKAVRIENADGAPIGVRVIVQHLRDGVWEDAPEVTFRYLPHPADLTTDYIHSHRRLIIQES